MTAPSLSFTLLMGAIGIILAITPHSGWEGVIFRSAGLSLLLLGLWLDEKVAERRVKRQ